MTAAVEVGAFFVNSVDSFPPGMKAEKEKRERNITNGPSEIYSRVKIEIQSGARNGTNTFVNAADKLLGSVTGKSCGGNCSV